MPNKKEPAPEAQGRKPALVEAGPRTFSIVGLGASAGGLDAVTSFLKAVPSDSGMAFVLMLNPDLEHEGRVAELLAGHVKMPVLMAKNGMPVAPDHVYVMPRDRHMEIEKGILHLSTPRNQRGTGRPINRFLMSLARDQGRNAVAAILSGTGSDGSAAITEIKAQGGLVLVQDPAEAEPGGMPRSAIATGAADHIVPIARMPGIIADFGQQFSQSPNNETTPNTDLQQEPYTERLSDDLDTFLAGSGLVTIFLDRDLRIMRFTPTARELFNLTREDIGRSISDFTSKVCGPALSDDIADVQQSHVPKKTEVRAQDGKWYHRQVSPYPVSDDRMGGLIITYSDISALKEFQRKTLAARGFAESIVDTVRDPLLVLDSDLFVIRPSRAFHKLFGTADSIVGRHFFTLANGQWDIPELRRSLGRIFPENRPIEAFSVTIDVPEKGRRAMKLNARRMVGIDGTTDRILVAIEDVTEQTQARHALVEREARLHAILDAVPEAIITTDARGIVTSYSPPSARILGYTQSEVLGHNVNMLMPESGRKQHDHCLSSYIAAGQTRVTGPGRGMEARHKSGELVPIHLRVSELEINGELQFMGIIRDLTEERENRKQLEQAQKMEAVGQLAGGMAHDFNNLLTVIIGNIELLEMRPDNPSRADILGEALEAANMGADLVAKLLLLSKKQILSAKRLNLDHAVEELRPLLQRTLGGSVEIITELDGGLAPVLADPGQVENALLNLSINARDAMQHGGTLTITTQNVTIDTDSPIEDKADLLPGDYVLLSVSDTGTGMAPDVIDRAFEPFFTTKEAGKGTGLGLPMIYRWARERGGDLTLRSEVDQGTVVRLYLPAIEADGDPDPRDVAASNTTLGHNGDAKILLVEDDPRVRNLTRSRLEHLGYSVVEAEDGPQALKLLEEQDDITLMFSDVAMPGGIDGIELAEKVQGCYPNLRIILATGFAPKVKEVAWPVLRKPYGIDTLAAALRKVLNGAA